jgi:DNA-binding transcriptional MocR family regulator
MASSPNNIARILEELKFQTIGHDKLNQLRHSRVFRNLEDVKEHLQKHKEIILPKFQLLYRVFEQELSGVPGVTWSKPNGGYFFTLCLPKGTAKRTVELCADAGLVVTPAGAMFPYGKDPEDSMLRIAPSFPSCEELEKAADLLTISARLAICEKYE